ncbi:hypothetical protein CAEBREN_28875 [Caenorhabditis brenneri]|uniref:Uncharacterized protein n=1 Tax=Caenorhabditis brenneri TaxID=135651 RepID=G0NKB2_CAEBE|nr:hypothetical protein CAEBREN_28875 [Caenorhabditis brenneri]
MAATASSTSTAGSDINVASSAFVQEHVRQMQSDIMEQLIPQDESGAVENLADLNVTSNLGRMTHYYFQQGGKMLRPTVSLLMGLATAPVLYACEQHPELVTMLLRKFKQDGDAERAREIVVNSDGMDRTRQLIDSYAQKAVEMASSLPNRNESTEQLIKLALSQSDRKF